MLVFLNPLRVIFGGNRPYLEKLAINKNTSYFIVLSAQACRPLPEGYTTSSQKKCSSGMLLEATNTKRSGA